ncbi:MAG: OmpA family protein [Filimonas sp.]|nr:OmpA family protein [Filimonas sp.]
MKTLRLSFIGFAALAIAFSSCKTWNNSQKGAAYGTAGGAAAGAIVGKIAGNTALGAIIGAAVGGGAGAVIGHKMDKQAEEIKTQVPDAKVERVEEGIVVEFNSAVLFQLNKFDLNDGAKQNLNSLITILNKYPDTNLEVDGHTDSTGTAEYNQTLSEKRAGAVAGYLFTNGIASARVTTKGFGKNFPKYPNSTPEGRAQNRRVEFLITANDKMKKDAQKEAAQ